MVTNFSKSNRDQNEKPKLKKKIENSHSENTKFQNFKKSSGKNNWMTTDKIYSGQPSVGGLGGGGYKYNLDLPGL